MIEWQGSFVGILVVVFQRSGSRFLRQGEGKTVGKAPRRISSPFQSLRLLLSSKFVGRKRVDSDSGREVVVGSSPSVLRSDLYQETEKVEVGRGGL